MYYTTLTAKSDCQSCVIHKFDRQSCVLHKFDRQSCLIHNFDGQTCVINEKFRVRKQSDRCLSFFSISYFQSVIDVFITPLCHILAWDNFSHFDKTSVQLVDVIDFCIGKMCLSD